MANSKTAYGTLSKVITQNDNTNRVVLYFNYDTTPTALQLVAGATGKVILVHNIQFIQNATASPGGVILKDDTGNLWLGLNSNGGIYYKDFGNHPLHTVSGDALNLSLFAGATDVEGVLEYSVVDG